MLHLYEKTKYTVSKNQHPKIINNSVPKIMILSQEKSVQAMVRTSNGLRSLNTLQQEIKLGTDTASETSGGQFDNRSQSGDDLKQLMRGNIMTMGIITQHMGARKRSSMTWT